MSSKRGFIGVTDEIEGIVYYNTSHVIRDSLLLLAPWTKGKRKAKVSILENGFKIEKILSPLEYNDILVEEFKSLNHKSNLVLTGSLALHLYKPLDRYVNNVDTLCTIDMYRKITDIVVPRDYYWYEDEDKRSWGVICPYGVNILVKHKLSYEIINDIKVSSIEDIISAKIDLAIETGNMNYMADLKNYKEYCNNLNLNYYG